jgi:rare lipoprotein A
MNRKNLRGMISLGSAALGTAALVVFPAAAPIHAAFTLPKPELSPEIGVATWYGERFNGLHTASGDLFDMNQLTAAHRKLPLGTLVRVVNLSNGRAVLVRINDRGPVVRNSMIDLSMAAASQLGMRDAGRAPVRLDLLPTN